MRLDKIGIGSQPMEYFQQRVLQQKNLVKDQKKNETEKHVNRDELKSVTSTMNSFLEPLRTNLKFEYHEELNEYYVTVVNPTTNETIREIPPKKMLDMYAAMVGFMGILIDEKI